MSDTIRVLRLLEYTGPRERVEEMIRNRSVKGSHEVGFTDYSVIIREAIIGDFPEVVDA